MTSSRSSKKTFEWVARLIVAGILFQTLFFKFTGAAESVYIFEQLGAEPWGRIGSGLGELIAGILILLPGSVGMGAVLAAGLMIGAIFSHLTVLGIVVQGDGGLLFGMACAVFGCAVFVVYLRRQSLPWIGKFL